MSALPTPTWSSMEKTGHRIQMSRCGSVNIVFCWFTIKHENPVLVMLLQWQPWALVPLPWQVSLWQHLPAQASL